MWSSRYFDTIKATTEDLARFTSMRMGPQWTFWPDAFWGQRTLSLLHHTTSEVVELLRLPLSGPWRPWALHID